MLKVLVISSGFVAAAALPVLAQDGPVTTIPAMISDTDPVHLASARPDFSVPVAPENNSNSFYSDQTRFNFRTNLADSFSREPSTLLLEPSLKRSTSNDAGFDSYSAEIRIGNVSFERSQKTPQGWYVFAAADGEALSMKTESIANVGDPMRVSLADQITVGDLQAGVSTYVADGTQLTISYIETEASYSGQGGISASKRESFAGISLAKKF